jgi:hypothetical protein
MTRKHPLNLKNGRRRSDRRRASRKALSVKKYKVGWCRPPKKFQFKPGQSGNPTGAKRKPSEREIKTWLVRSLIEWAVSKTELRAKRSKSKKDHRQSRAR